MNANYQEMDLKELIGSIKKNWWILLVLMLVGIGVSYIVSVEFITPLYQADTTLFIGSEENSLGISLSDLNRNNQLIEDYRNLAETRLVIESVISAVDYNVTVKEFRERMDIQVIEDSRLFVVSYRSENRFIATDVANELGKQLSLVVLEIVGVKNIRIIDPAIVPEKAVEPNVMRNSAFGGMTGIVVGMIITLILILRDDKILDKSFVEEVVQVPIIGSIPSYDEKSSSIFSNTFYVKNIPNYYISECYKMLRSNITYLSMQNNSKVLMFTSSSMSEGKTTTITNLAVSMAKEGKRILLIDADLRRPNIHKRFELRQNPGLTSLLLSRAEFSRTIRRVDSIQNLDILTSGSIPPSPDLLLGSVAFKTLVNEVREEYDYILIDTTPTLIVSDAIVVTRVVDDVILVVAMEQARKTDIVNAVSSLNNVGISLAAVVTTKEKIQTKDKYYGDYLSK